MNTKTSSNAISFIIATINILLLLLTTVQGRIFFGGCPNVETMDGFDTSLYTGRWYEYQRDRSTTFETFLQCVTATYTARSDGLIWVRNCGEYGPFAGCGTGRAKCYTTGGCYVSFDKKDKMTKDPNYLVLGTDYISYTVVYSCEKVFGFLYQDDLWILTRDNIIDKEVKDAAHDVIKEKAPFYDFEEYWGYETTQNKNCEYPE